MPDNPETRTNRRLLLAVATLLSLGVLLFDLYLPLGVAGGVPYVVPVLIAVWAGDLRTIFIFACVGTALTLVGYAGSPAGGIPWVVFANRMLAIGAIWLTAVLCAAIYRGMRRQIHANDRYRAVFDQVSDGIVTFSLDGRITDANPAALQMFGHTYEEMLSIADEDILPSEAGEQRFLVPSAAPQSNHTLVERQGRRRDGASIDLEASRKQLLVGQIAAVFRDVTERKRAEKELRQLRQALDHSPLKVMITDLDGTIEYINPALAATTGLLPTELIGSRSEALRTTTLIGSHYEVLWDTIASGKIWRQELQTTGGDADKEHRWEEVSISGVRDEQGKVIRLLAIKDDITKRKRVEQQLKVSLQEKEVLLRELHHRVRNNLQIVSSLFNLRRRRAVAECGGCTTLLDTETSVRAMALVHQAPQATSEYDGEIDLGRYVTMLANELFRSHGLDRGKIALQLKAESVSIVVDKAISCGLILNELISNAARHAFPNRRSGTIEVGCRRDDVGQLLLLVADDGIGPSQPYDLTAPQTTGMQLVVSLVQQLKGQIVLSCDAGTRFEIRVPRQTK